MTDLIATPDYRVQLREGATTVTAIAAQGVKPVPAPLRDPETPKALVITDEVRAALKKLPSVFAATEVTERRELDGKEISLLFDEQEVLEAVADLLIERRETIKTNIRNHIDEVSLAQGRVADEGRRDSKGHYIVASKGNPVRVPVPGHNKEYSLEFRSGRSGTASISSERLLQMYEEGELTREQYLGLTRETRVFDEQKATKAVLDDPSLMEVVKRAVTYVGQTADSQGLYVRKAK